MHSEAERAAKLIDWVLIKVLQHPQNYHEFISVLMCDYIQYGHTLQYLKQTYDTYKNGNVP